MPDKISYRISVPGEEAYSVDADKFNQKKDEFFNQYPDAEVVEVSPYNQDDIKPGDYVSVSVPGEEPYAVESRKFAKKRDEFFQQYPDAQVSRMRQVNYWGDRLSDNYARRQALEKELAGYANNPVPTASRDENGNYVETTQIVMPSKERKKAIEAELKTLNEEREKNPMWRKYWDSQAKEIGERRYGAKVAKEASDRGDYDRELYGVAEKLYDDAYKVATAPSKYNGMTGMDNAGQYVRDMARGAWDNAWDAVSMVSLANALKLGTNLVPIIKRITEHEGEKANILELSRNPEKLDYLSNGEKELLHAFGVKAEVEAGRSADLSKGYKAGKGVAQSVGYMSDFLLMGGAVEGIGKKAIEKTVEGTAKRLATETLYGAAKAAVMTPLMASSYTNFINNMMQFNDAGGIDLSAKAIRTAVQDVLIENESELIGAAPLQALGLGVGKALPKDWLSKSVLGGWGKALRHSPAFRVMKRAGWNGLVEEMFEEVTGNALRALTNTDSDALKNFFNPEELLVTATSFLPMSLIGGAVTTAQYTSASVKKHNAGVALSKVLEESGMDKNAIKKYLDLSKSETPTQIASQLSGAYQAAVESGEVSPEVALKAVLGYAKTSANYKVMTGILEEQQDEDRVAMATEIEATLGKDSWRHSTIDGESVRTLTDKDGNVSYVTEEKKDGGFAVIKPDGTMGLVGPDAIISGEYTDSGEMPLNDYLDSAVQQKKKVADEARMQQEAQAARQQLKRNIENNVPIEMGTEENPITGELVRDESGAPVMNEGLYQIAASDGSTHLASAGDLASKWGIQLQPESQEEKDDNAVKQQERSRERKDLYNTIPKNTPIKAMLEGAEEPVEHQFVRSYIDSETGDVMVEAIDSETGETVQLPEQAFPELEDVAADLTSKIGETPAAESVDDGIARDYKGRPLPLDGEGNVDEDKLWNEDPVAWAKWNDKMRGSSENSIDYIQLGISTEQAKLANLQSAYATTMGYKERHAIEDEQQKVTRRLGVLQNLLESYNDVAAVEQAISEEQAAPVEAAPAVEEKTPERIEAERQEPLIARAEEWSKRTGVPVTTIRSFEEIPESEMAARTSIKMTRAAKKRISGWYSLDSGNVMLYLPNITDEAEISKTFLHEVIAHKGLREMLGQEAFDQLMQRTWDEIMTDEDKSYYRKYAMYSVPNASEEKLKLIAADEYIAHLAENINTNPTAWDKFVSFVKEIIEKLFGDAGKITKDDLSQLLQASLARYEASAERMAEKAEVQMRMSPAARLSNDGVAANEDEARFSIKYAPKTEEEADKIADDISEQDKEYMDAVESGNLSRAKEMVREAAAKAMPNTVLRDKDGMPLLMIHNTRSEFTVFDLTRSLGKAAYFADKNAIESGEVGGFIPGDINMEVFLNLENPVESNDYTDFEEAREKGHDGALTEVTLDNGEIGRVAAVFSAEQIKSANAVEYDDDGNVIPLSERFNPQSSDIRFRRVEDLAKIRELENGEKEVGYRNVVMNEARFSIKYAPKNDEEATKMAEDIAEQIGVPKTQAEAVVRSETSLASIIGQKEYAPYLDYTADDRFNAIKENSDYPQGTVDFNNICRKRIAFTEMYQRLQQAFPNVIITGEDLANIRNIMKSHGLEVACGLCYVEDRRQLLGEIAKGFIDDLADGFKGFSERKGAMDKPGDKGSVAARKKVADELLEMVGEDKKDDLSIYDLITLEGSTKLYSEHPGIYAAFNKYNSNRGQASGNLFQGYAEYKREILKWSRAKVKSVNDNGGLRIFSYSDFEAHHLIDLVQIVIDCARMGVKIQGYTKVPAFARAVANTGIKLNRSLIPLGDTGIVDGKLAYDTVEGIDINDENFLESNANVGNILVGINDQQIRMAMADPFIHYIIPYHTNQKGELRKLRQVGKWVNYKSSQNDRNISDGKADKKNQVNIYTDVIAAADAEGKPITNEREFTERFLQVCKEKGLIPRFEQFLDRVGGEYVYTPGYYKLLLDFKMFDEQGNYLPQMPVVPEFDDAFNAQILSDYVKGEQVKYDENLDDVYNEIVDKLGLNERQPDIVAQKKGEKALANILSALEKKGEARAEEPAPAAEAAPSFEDELLRDGYSYGNKSLLEQYGLQAADLTRRGDVVTLNRLITNERKQGAGTRFMQDLAAMADRNGWSLALTPTTAFGASSVGRLNKFYKRFGFKDNKGTNTDFSISESMIRRPANETMNQVRFRISNADERVFISNAEAALDKIKMDRATPEQWLKMLEKEGGMKAAEDKWLGLSDWLKLQSDRKSIGKEEIAEYIAKNQIIIEEQRYAEEVEDAYGKALNSYQDEFDAIYNGMVDEDSELAVPREPYLIAQDAFDEMIERYGEDFSMAFSFQENGDGFILEPEMDWNDELTDAAKYFLDQRRENSDVRAINSTRKGYTTEGLRNLQEIALTVPTIDPWNEGDIIHFGDAGEGRAIAWVRFGDSWTSEAKDEAEKKYREAQKKFLDYKNEIVAKYALKATDTKKTRDLATDEENAKVKELHLEEQRLYHEWQYGSHKREKVLVIDEIQSKRHQEAREQGGYMDDTLLKQAEASRDAAKKAYDDYHNALLDKYGNFNEMRDKITPEENAESQRLYLAFRDAENSVARNGFDPNVDEEYRRIKEELSSVQNDPEFLQAMKDWREALDEYKAIEEERRDTLKLALMSAEDRAASTKKALDAIERKDEATNRARPFQERSRELQRQLEHREAELAHAFNEQHKSKIPAAPFEKNWHELALKRMLRYAAEMGYDSIAWTTGEQQAERYNIGTVVDKIHAFIDAEGTREVWLYQKFGGPIVVKHDENGEILDMENTNGVLDAAKNLSDIVGKEMAADILESVKERGMDAGKEYTGEQLRVGSEGMKGFYDDILPRFMNKYGKKWNAKVEDVFLPALGEDAAAGAQNGLTMHSVKVTPEMRESVMQGQLMFRMAEYNEEIKEVDAIDTDKLITYHGSGADFEKFDHSHMGEGEGSQVYGWGTYVTTNLDTGMQYALNLGGHTDRNEELIAKWEEELKDENLDEARRAELEQAIAERQAEIDAVIGKRHLYTVEIPADNGQNYLHWDKYLTRQQSNKIMDAVRKLADKDMWGSEFEYELKSALGYGTLGRHVEGGLDYFLGDLRDYATDENPGAERNAKILSELGIVGLEIPVDYGGGQKYEGSNYVIFDEKDLNIVDHLRFRITPEQDKEYLDVVEAGDMAKAQEMVRDAAALAMPNTKVVDKDGKPMVVYHGTPDMSFTKFAKPGEDMQGLIWMTDQKRYAEVYAEEYDGEGYPNEGAGVYSLFANIENPLDMGYIEDVVGSDSWNNLAEKLGMTPEELFNKLKRIDSFTYEDAQKRMMYIYDYTRDAEFANLLKEKGFDGAFALEEGINKTPTYAAVEPSQVKSAEPVERDNGKVIPLSERFNPESRDIRFRTEDAIEQARAEVDTNPTDAQKEAGNYKHGHLTIDGFDISLENPKGSVRSGKDADGNEWHTTMNNDYGYIRMTEGVDGDHIDVFLSDNPNEGNVYVVDQVDPKTGEFDEHKVMYGFNSMEEARDAYMSNYSDGWQGLGTITGVTKDEFKKWIESSTRKTKPFSEYKSVNAEEAQGESHDEGDGGEGGTLLRMVEDPAKIEEEESAIRFRLREGEAPKKTQKVYKLMRRGNTKDEVYPLYIDSSEPLKIGNWYDAASPAMKDIENLDPGYAYKIDANGEVVDKKEVNRTEKGSITKLPSADEVNSATVEGARWITVTENKKGEKSYHNVGINGSGATSTYAMRPGWHAGSLPTMRQIGKGKNKDIRDDSYVWVEGEVPADVDYQAEAEGNPNKDIPTHIPTDGYYLKATNADKVKSQADRVGWYVAGSFKPNRIIGDDEARSIIDQWNKEHPDAKVEYDYEREGGRVFNAETGELEEPVDTADTGEVDGIRFSLRGLGGAQNAEDQVALDNLDIAGEMEQAGKDPNAIWQATGWQRGADGMWRNEIPDAKQKDGIDLSSRTYKAEDILDAPELFASYPELKDYAIVIKKLPGNISASFNSKAKTLTIDPENALAHPDGKFGPAVLSTNGVESVLHELQHAIQHIEGFAKGSSSTKEEKDFYRSAIDATPEMAYFAWFFSKRNTKNTLLDAGPAGIVNTIRNIDKSAFTERDQQELARVEEYLDNITDEEFKSLVKEAAKLVKQAKDAAKTNYHISAGEVEARNVEIRSHMSERVRRLASPETSEDTNREDQIVRFRITPEQDAEYMEAVNAGDMEKASKMVEDAAKAAGYTIKAYHGGPYRFNAFDKERLGHATGVSSAKEGFFFTDDAKLANAFAKYSLDSADFRDLMALVEEGVKSASSEVIDRNYEYLKKAVDTNKYDYDDYVADSQDRGEEPTDEGFLRSQAVMEDGKSIEDAKRGYILKQIVDHAYDGDYFNETGNWDEFITAVKDFAEIGHTQAVYLKIENPLVDEIERDYYKGGEEIDVPMTKVLQQAKKEGHDGVIFTNIKEGWQKDFGPQYVIFEPEQAKSADAVERDDNGNVIPLSQRFNAESDDIRFRVSEDMQTAADLVQQYEEQDGGEFPWMTERELMDKFQESIPYGADTEDLYAMVDKYNRLDEADFEEGRRDFSGSEKDEVFNEFLEALREFSQGDEETRYRAQEVGRSGKELVKRVQDYGLAGVMDKDSVNAFWSFVLYSLPEDTRMEIIDKAFGDDLNIRKQTRAYMADLAAKGYANDASGLLFKAADQLSALIPEHQPLSYDELLYMMWRGSRRYSSNDMLAMATDITMRRRLHVGEFTGDKFPEDAKTAVEQTKAEIEEAGAERTAERSKALWKTADNPYGAIVNAMTAQKNYDQKTIDSLVALAKEMMRKGDIDKVTSREMARLLTIIKAANGRKTQTMKNSADQLLDFMVDHSIATEKGLIEKIMKLKTAKVKEPGVDIITKLDIRAQGIINAFKGGMKSSVEEIQNRLAEVQNQIDSDRTSETRKEELRAEQEGLTLALRHATDIAGSEAEAKAIRESINDSEQTHKGLDPEERKKMEKAHREEIAAAYDMIRQNKIARVEAYRNLRADLAAAIDEGVERAKSYIESERERVEHIHHMANSDLQGVEYTIGKKDEKKGFQKIIHGAFEFIMSPLANTEQLFRVLGRKSPSGEGYLYNYYVRGIQRAWDEEKKGIDAAYDKLNDKVRELFGDQTPTWHDLFIKVERMPAGTMRWFDASGKWVEEPVTKGNLLYIYMVNKMADGRMKLRQMGISEEDVFKIPDAVGDTRLFDLADWIQEDFLSGLRDKYNAVHNRMFGTSMAAIENYFPLRISKGAVHQEVELGKMNASELASTLTGAIIKRTVNTKQLDLLNADMFTVLSDHIDEMEEWSAFAEIRRDMNTLLSYDRFRNKVESLNTVFGTGEDLWRNMADTFGLAIKMYKPKRPHGDAGILNAAKGVSAAKVNFRIYTALKQILSFPAFLADARVDLLAKSLATPWMSWKWAMENLPSFKRRWETGTIGNEKLDPDEADSKIWNTKIGRFIMKDGMLPNRMVDAMTIAIGAKAMYDSKYNQYVKEGFDEAVADEKAKTDAELLFNATQQSSEGLFLSTIQKDRTLLSNIVSVFRNSSMGYGRQVLKAFRSAQRVITGGKAYKAESLEYMTKQLVREGLGEEEAAKAARKRFNKTLRDSVVRYAVFGFMLEFLWNLGSHAIYLLFGDDPDEKEKMLKEDFKRAELGGLVEGLAGGQAISELLYDLRIGEKIYGKNYLQLPLAQDAKTFISELTSDRVRAVNDLVNLAFQIGIGANPQTVTDAIIAILDACNGDMEVGKEIMLCIWRILQVPQSQLDQLMIDEIGMSARDARELSYEEIAERYAYYKIHREAPLTSWAYSDETMEKKVKNKKSTFKKKVKERNNE